MCNVALTDDGIVTTTNKVFVDKYELLLYKVINNRLAAQRNRMINILAEVFRRQEKDVNKRLTEIIRNDAAIFNLNKWNKVVADSVRRPIFEAGLDGFNAGINQKRGGYFYFTKQDEEDVSILFTLNNPGIDKWLDEATLVFADTVNQNIQRGLDKIIKDVIEEGGTVEQMRREIQERVNRRYTFIYGKRGEELLSAAGARRMAQTETTKAQNSGHLSGLKEGGVVKHKAWLSSRNEKVRATHTAADNRYTRNSGIPLDENFRVGNAWISTPGNLVSGNVGEIINCFCSVIPARKGRSRGGNTSKPPVSLPKPTKRKTSKRSLQLIGAN